MKTKFALDNEFDYKDDCPVEIPERLQELSKEELLKLVGAIEFSARLVKHLSEKFYDILNATTYMDNDRETIEIEAKSSIANEIIKEIESFEETYLPYKEK